MNEHFKTIEFVPEGPQQLSRKVPRAKPYPVEALGALRSAVEMVQRITQAPMGVPAASALSLASLAVQGHADVETLLSSCPSSLFVLTIARSGERKSSCDALMMRELRKFELGQADEHRVAVGRWRMACAVWKAKHDRILSQVKGSKGGSTAELEKDLEKLGPDPSPPPAPDRTVTEPTFEGLTRLFAEGNPSLGIFSDEGGQFLGGHAMGRENRQKTLAALNDLWSGNPIRRTRQGDGSSTLRGRRLAIHLMVQPGVAQAFMDDPATAGIGFLPRFLISEPPSTIGTRLHMETQADNVSLQNFSRRLQEILETSTDLDPKSQGLTPRLLRLSSEARQLLVAFSNAIETEQGPDGSLAHVTGYASKAAEQAARIAAVLTMWDDLNANQVSAQTMADAITLAQFYLGEAARLSEVVLVSAEIEHAEKLGKWMIDKWPHGEILLSDILQHASIRALRDRPTAKKAIGILVEAGWLVPMPLGSVVRGKSRREAYHIVAH